MNSRICYEGMLFFVLLKKGRNTASYIYRMLKTITYATYKKKIVICIFLWEVKWLAFFVNIAKKSLTFWYDMLTKPGIIKKQITTARNSRQRDQKLRKYFNKFNRKTSMIICRNFKLEKNTKKKIWTKQIKSRDISIFCH